MTDIEKSQESQLDEASALQKLMKFSFEDMDLAFFSSAKEMFAYKGFDPAELIEKMRQLQPDEAALDQDLSFLVTEFLAVGQSKKSGNKKIPKKRKKDIIELKRLTEFYGISRDSSHRETITLRRIAIAFAPITVRILMKNQIERPVSNTELHTMAGDSLPWCIRTQIYLCALPGYDSPVVAAHKALFKTAIQATICYCYLESKILSKKGSEHSWTSKDYMTDVMKYAVISIKSEHLSEKECSDLWNDTLPFLSDGQAAMERLIQCVESEVPESASLFESNFGPFVS